MIIIGIGFLYAPFKRYGWSAIGFNFFLSAFTLQWSIICGGFFHDFVKIGNHDEVFHHYGDELGGLNTTKMPVITVNIDR